MRGRQPQDEDTVTSENGRYTDGETGVALPITSDRPSALFLPLGASAVREPPRDY